VFTKARIKLTFWYVAIIMMVSFSFSTFIYKSVSLEFQRRLNVIERRFKDEVPRGWRMHGPVHEYFLQDLTDARAGLVFILLYANGVIFILSAAAGYILSGKSLAPIESAMEEQKRFVADASHELKTPLTTLKTSIEVTLRDKKLNLKNAKKALRESLEDIDQLKNLTNDLLSLTRYQQNASMISRRKIDMRDAVDSVVKNIAPLAKNKNITLKLTANSLELRANKEDMEKLITILLDNAVKFTPKRGKISISLSKSARNIIVKIKDTGVGISKKDLPHVFDRFYRTDNSRSKLKTDGFGLGLSMAKKIVELHKGSIKVKSKLGKGSTFTVKFPL
jgi:signal transduction histidine kinase